MLLAVKRIRVHPRDLEVGDVVETFSEFRSGPRRRNRIEQIGEVQNSGFSGPFRAAVIRDLRTDECGKIEFAGFGIIMYDVVDGPKIRAARRNPNLVEMNKFHEWNWKGVNHGLQK